MATESARALLKRHELLAELQDVVARQLSDMGVAADTAALVAAFLVDYLSTYWAGQVVSFPKDAFYKLTLKELEVLSLFQGDNYDQLARQFGMTLVACASSSTASMRESRHNALQKLRLVRWMRSATPKLKRYRRWAANLHLSHSNRRNRPRP